MKKIIHDGIPAGNWYNKYETKNPISNYLMNNFFKSIKELLFAVKPEINSITEIGCGEGYLSEYILSLNIVSKMKASDFSSDIIEIAKRKNNPDIKFYIKSIYEIGDFEKSDILICCEVLEHLKDPAQGLKKLYDVTNKYLIVSVPNEPLWRVLNCCRGKYLSDFGNTPGHINHWSKKNFKNFVGELFNVIEVNSPLPWTVILAEKK